MRIKIMDNRDHLFDSKTILHRHYETDTDVNHQSVISDIPTKHHNISTIPFGRFSILKQELNRMKLEKKYDNKRKMKARNGMKKERKEKKFGVIICYQKKIKIK
jgi:hypothetical protein